MARSRHVTRHRETAFHGRSIIVKDVDKVICWGF
jgi:hypothetical protein